MLLIVSPVITGADAASPQPTRPLSAAMRTSTLSARRTSSPAMITGLSIGRLTATGSIVLTCTADPLELLHASFFDNVLKHRDFLGHACPGGVGALRPHLEAGLVKLLLHLRRAQHFQGFRLQPFDDFG